MKVFMGKKEILRDSSHLYWPADNGQPSAIFFCSLNQICSTPGVTSHLQWAKKDCLLARHKPIVDFNNGQKTFT